MGQHRGSGSYGRHVLLVFESFPYLFLLGIVAQQDQISVQSPRLIAQYEHFDSRVEPRSVPAKPPIVISEPILDFCPLQQSLPFSPLVRFGAIEVRQMHLLDFVGCITQNAFRSRIPVENIAFGTENQDGIIGQVSQQNFQQLFGLASLARRFFKLPGREHQL